MFDSIDELFLNDGNIDKRKFGRCISALENSFKDAEKILSKIYSPHSEAVVIGITGPPGGGKSTLTNELIKKFREKDKTVGVIAVDPTSPFSGGAILGDRVRMTDHSSDKGVFIRSMGSRGNLGGLGPATANVMNLMKSAGFDAVIIETVGVGQSEVEVMHLADAVLLILVPGMGDDIQAMKAGIMEIADIFVVNKADKDGKEKLLAEINMLVHINRDKLKWVPPVVETVAVNGEGVFELMKALDERMGYISDNRDYFAREKCGVQFSHMAKDKIGGKILAFLEKEGIFSKWIDEVAEKKVNPYKILRNMEKKLEIKWRRDE